MSWLARVRHRLAAWSDERHRRRVRAHILKAMNQRPVAAREARPHLVIDLDSLLVERHVQERWDANETERRGAR